MSALSNIFLTAGSVLTGAAIIYGAIWLVQVVRALPTARATHEPSPDGLGHSVGVPNAVGPDAFNGDTDHLRQCIAALLALDDDGAFRPHGIGGHAHKLLTAAYHRLAD